MLAGRLRMLRLEPDVPVAGCKQSLQVAPDEEQIGQPAQRPERQTVVDDVDDAGAAWELLEAVLVAPGHERSALHLVHEPPRPVVVDDLGGHAPPDPKVACLPGHLLPRADQAAGHPGDRPLLGGPHRATVQVDVATQSKAALDRRVDVGHQDKVGHDLPLVSAMADRRRRAHGPLAVLNGDRESPMTGTPAQAPHRSVETDAYPARRRAARVSPWSTHDSRMPIALYRPPPVRSCARPTTTAADGTAGRHRTETHRRVAPWSLQSAVRAR